MRRAKSPSVSHQIAASRLTLSAVLTRQTIDGLGVGLSGLYLFLGGFEMLEEESIHLSDEMR